MNIKKCITLNYRNIFLLQNLSKILFFHSVLCKTFLLCVCAFVPKVVICVVRLPIRGAVQSPCVSCMWGRGFSPHQGQNRRWKVQAWFLLFGTGEKSSFCHRKDFVSKATVLQQLPWWRKEGVCKMRGRIIHKMWSEIKWYFGCKWDKVPYLKHSECWGNWQTPITPGHKAFRGRPHNSFSGLAEEKHEWLCTLEAETGS